MKVVLASSFVIGAACFFGYSLSRLGQLVPPAATVEITVIQAEKGFSYRPHEVLYLRKRTEWSM